MKTTRVSGAQQRASVSYLHSARPVTVDAALSRLERALRQVEDLKRSLASSRQESVAAQRRIEILSKVNAQLMGFAAQHEGAYMAVECPAWELANLSLAAGLDPDELRHIACLLTKRVRFQRGDVLYRTGDGFDALYAIRSGSCKSVFLARDGQDQVTGYHLAGEIIGTDGIGSNVHECEATALEHTEVWLLPFARIETLARFSDRFRHNLHSLLSQECSRAHALMLLLGTMRADRRLAVFLLDLSQRYLARGFSSSEFALQMTRGEIGSYLGLQLETVSRQFARFQRGGLIQVQGRQVKLLDRAALSRVADCGA